jgi:hypothetical protein
MQLTYELCELIMIANLEKITSDGLQKHMPKMGAGRVG